MYYNERDREKGGEDRGKEGGQGKRMDNRRNELSVKIKQ